LVSSFPGFSRRGNIPQFCSLSSLATALNAKYRSFTSSLVLNSSFVQSLYEVEAEPGEKILAEYRLKQLRESGPGKGRSP